MTGTARTPKAPNVLIVHWHDLGTHLAAYGEDVVSPRSEALASESLVFDRCFAAAPLCSPARGALWTGRHPHSNGLMGLVHRGWEYGEDEETLPDHLTRGGYHTALIGLQHESSDPARTGFREIETVRPASADDVAARAEQWLSSHRDDDQPWLLTCGMVEVHRPWSDANTGQPQSERASTPGRLPDNDLTRQDLTDFRGAITRADAALGRIVDAVEAMGLSDSTMIIFTTDHGAPFPWAKSTLYDAGVRVALMVRPPRSWRRSPGRIDQLVSHVDVVPTVLELADVAIPETVQGCSLADLIKGTGEGPVRSEVYLEKTYHGEYDPIRGIRTDTHKYLVNFEDRPWLQLPSDLENSLTRRGMDDEHLEPRPPCELYDLRSDPLELTNLAGRTEHEGVQTDLDRRLRNFLHDTGDPLLAGPIANPDPSALANPAETGSKNY